MTTFQRWAPALGFLLGLLPAAASAVTSEACHSAAREQAQRLLEFHFGPDDRIAIREAVRWLGRIPNPAASEESFEHLEVWGDIYKGRYRMRFLYAELYDGCILMGQDILEFAELGLNSAATPHRTDGIVRDMTLGDRACYLSIEVSDGSINERMAVMSLCERSELIGHTVSLSTDKRAVMASHCEGDPGCPDVEWLELIVEAVPE